MKPGKKAPLVILLLLIGACSHSKAKKDPQPWTVSFWVWPDSLSGQPGLPEPAKDSDSIYVNVGNINRYAGIRTRDWPSNLPAAKQYWALWRYEPPLVPREEHVSGFVAGYEKVRNQASIRGRQVAGLQLDYDCPTGELSNYGVFVARLRKELPPGTLLSVTALLDWFRPGTDIGRLLAHVSEFVPQFYDVAERGEGGSPGIAKSIDPAKWAPLFNRHKLPYRVGISTFGRISLQRQGASAYFRDLAPIDVLAKIGLQCLESETTPAGEKRFVIRAEDSVRIGYRDLNRDDRLELVLPTRESVRSAYDAARNMGGFCAGAVFFRWPAARESLVMTPGEIRSAIADVKESPAPASLASYDGDCVAVHCSDLYLRLPDRFPDRNKIFVIRSPQPLEYFLPAQRLESIISLSGRGLITVRLPAYHGERELPLGRAVTLRPAHFTVEEDLREKK